MDTANQRAAQARDDDHEADQYEIFGRLPNDWARNPKASAGCLCMVAYRCTYADDKTRFGLWEDRLSRKPILVGGFGQNVRARAIATAMALGWLNRPHNSKLPRGPGYTFKRSFDRLNLPADLTSENSHMVWRAWFDGSLSCGEMAALLYLQAGTGKGPGVYARELEDRFNWSPPTALAVLRALRRRGIVEMQRQHGARGRVRGVTYIVRPDIGMQLPAAVPEQDIATHKNPGDGQSTTHKKPGDGLPGDGSPRDGLPGHIRRDSPNTEDSPERNIPSHSIPPSSREGERLASRGRQDDGYFAKEEIQPLRPERIILADWKASSFFQDAEWKGWLGRFFDQQVNNEPVLDLPQWNQWLDRFGGAPAHLRTPAAHRSASEIARVLAAVLKKRVHPNVALVGLAYAICSKHERRRDIRSLGFIAESLVRKAQKGDDTWALDVPHNAEFKQVAAVAADWVDILGIGAPPWDYGISFDRRQLLSPFQVANLYGLIQHHGRSTVVEAINYAARNKLDHDQIIIGWDWAADHIEAAKAAKAAAAAPPPQPAPPQPVRQGAGWDAELEAACKWLRTHLGTTWHNSQRLKGAAKEVGISREALRAAMERVERQTIPGPNYQWITAMPGIPLPMANDGDIIGTIKAADHNCLVANRLYRQGAQPLLAYVRSQAEKHGCTQDDVIAVILDVLRRASSPEHGARQKVLVAMIGANCGVGKPRYDIARWTDFDRMIADGLQHKEKTA